MWKDEEGRQMDIIKHIMVFSFGNSEFELLKLQNCFPFHPPVRPFGVPYHVWDWDCRPIARNRFFFSLRRILYSIFSNKNGKEMKNKI